MRGWAFNKIYYLISRMTSQGESAAALDATVTPGTRREAQVDVWYILSGGVLYR